MYYVSRDMPSLTREMYARLEAEGILYATQCGGCGELYLPPRARCSACGSPEFEWSALSGRGELYAFTQQPRALRFTIPSVVGVVVLEEGPLVFGVIDSPFGALSIGDSLKVKVIEDEIGPPVLGFEPEAEG